MLKFKTPVQLNTVGDGYWSSHKTAVAITHMNLAYINDEWDFGELRVYFTRHSWNCTRHGLIYTDSQWLTELKQLLNSLGYDGDAISYSEQGMQGTDYVSLDVWDNFIKTWDEKHQVTV